MARAEDNLNNIPGMPYSLEAEQAVLGCALLDEGCLNTVMMQVRRDAFFYPLHQLAYDKIKTMVDNGKRPDLITVLEALSGEVDMATEELRDYLLRICQIVPTLSGLNSYIKIIQDKYYLRALYGISKETIDSVMSGTAEADMILERAEQQIYDIRQGREIRGPMEIKKVLTAFYDELNELSKTAGGMRGIPSGYADLDHMLSGLNRSDLIILAARPGVGKTSFALNIAVNVAKQQAEGEGAVCVFSLEMSSVQLVQRLLAAEAAVDMGSIINGTIDADQSVRIAGASGALSGTKFYIDDSSNITVSEIKARLRKIKNLKLVVIDYLQLISSGRRSGGDNRTAEVSEMTRALKIMAKEINVPVIVLSQLSRDSVKVGSKTGEKARKPELSDLRESGSIEQDADIVMFLHFERDENAPDGKSNKCELLVRKNRHGPAGSVWLLWQGKYTKFSPLENYAPDDEG